MLPLSPAPKASPQLLDAVLAPELSRWLLRVPPLPASLQLPASPLLLPLPLLLLLHLPASQLPVRTSLPPTLEAAASPPHGLHTPTTQLLGRDL
jgi:hypothetical protein